jgi:hypothetical protein
MVHVLQDGDELELELGIYRCGQILNHFSNFTVHVDGKGSRLCGKLGCGVDGCL